MNSDLNYQNSNNPLKHNLFDDIFALLTGSLIISFGISLFNQVGLLTGGTAGFAFLIHYSSNFSFGSLFFIINFPFYILAFKKLGLRFTLKTFLAVALVSLFSNLHPKFIQVNSLTPFYVAVMGGLLMGVGFIVLFRHNASLGGVNILSLYLQDNYQIPAGKTQMFIDLVIVFASFFIVDTSLILVSLVGAITMNLCILINHKPGRYITV